MRNPSFKRDAFQGLWKGSCQTFIRQFGNFLLVVLCLMPFGLVLAYLYPYYAPFLFLRATISQVSLVQYWSMALFFLLVPGMAVFLFAFGALVAQADLSDDEASGRFYKLLSASISPFFRLLPRMVVLFTLGWMLCLLGDRVCFFARQYWIHHDKLSPYSEALQARHQLLVRILLGLASFMVCIYFLDNTTILHTFASYLYIVSPEHTFSERSVVGKQIFKKHVQRGRFYEIFHRLPTLLVPLVIVLFSSITGESVESLLGGVLAKVILWAFICFTFLFSMIMRASFWNVLREKMVEATKKESHKEPN